MKGPQINHDGFPHFLLSVNNRRDPNCGGSRIGTIGSKGFAGKKAKESGLGIRAAKGFGLGIRAAKESGAGIRAAKKSGAGIRAEKEFGMGIRAAKESGAGRRAAVVVLLALLAIACPPAAYANSAEPPGLTVIVVFPPDDLDLSIRFSDGTTTEAASLQKEERAWEAYYRFFYGSMPSRHSFDGAVLVAESEGHSFECPLPESSFGAYNNLITLDFKNRSISVGQPPGRLPLLISMRVALTLLLEGLLFLAFGYRKKKSWIIFVVVNLITQGALNALLTGPNLGSYWLAGFFLYEIAIFVVEAIVFALMLREHKKRRAIGFALTANFASLIFGGIIISSLPV